MQAVTTGSVNMITQAEDIVTEVTRDATRVVIMALINMMRGTVVEVTYIYEGKQGYDNRRWHQRNSGSRGDNYLY